MKVPLKVHYRAVLYTVRKMCLILLSKERMLKMQFSMARKFTLQPLRRYDVKPLKKTGQACHALSILNSTGEASVPIFSVPT